MWNPRTPSRIQNQRGTILLATLAIVVFLTIFTFVGTTKLHSDSRTGTTYEQKIKAEYVSRAGLQLALEQLFLDSAWASSTLPQNITFDLVPDGRLQARLTVYNNKAGTGVITTASGVALAPGQVHIDSRAFIDGKEYGGSFGQASSVLTQPTMEFKHAVYDNDFGVGQRTGDAWVDAYDSTIEELTDVYQWQTGQPTKPSAVAPFDGRGGSSVRTGGVITSRIDVYGDIYIPKGAVINQAHPVGGTIIEGVDPAIPWIIKLPVDLESAPVQSMAYNVALPPGNYGSVSTPDNSTIIFSRGDFRFDKLMLGKNSRILLQEDAVAPYQPTRIFLTQQAEFDEDCLINMEPEFPGARQSQAGELLILGTDGPGREQTMVWSRNGVRFRGVLAGYRLDINQSKFDLSGLSPNTIGTVAPSGRHGVDYFGAIYGETLGHKAGVRYHYDKALGSLTLDDVTQWVLHSQGNLR